MDMEDAAPEGGEDLGEADEPEMGMDKEEIAKELIQAIGSVLGVDLDIDSEPEGEMEECQQKNQKWKWMLKWKWATRRYDGRS